MIDYQIELEKMVMRRQLMNSYKLFLLKAIFSLCFEERQSCDFYELGCRMVSFSWPYVMAKKNRLSIFDKLYDVAVLAVEKEDLLESSSQNSIRLVLQTTSDLELRKSIAGITQYAPYRLLSFQWKDDLKGKSDAQKNKMIESYSQIEESFYSIHGKSIVVNQQWYKYIESNFTLLNDWLDIRIENFCNKN